MNKFSNLCHVLDVALEQDQAERLGLAQERALRVEQPRSSQSGDECAPRRHRRGLAWPPRQGQESEAAQSVGLHNTIAASRLQAGAELHGLLASAERPDHGAVVDALGAEVRATHRVRLTAEYARVLRLDAAVGRFGVGFA